MRVAMFEGYGAVSSPPSDARVEQFIRDQIAVMQGVQSALWEAYGKWRAGQTMLGIAFPAAVLLQIGRYDYRYSVDSWQASVDTWWKSEMTDVVRSAPFERGADGKTRLDAWTKMAQGLIEWSQRIARDMHDDTALKVFTDFGESLKFVIREAIAGGLKIAVDIIPGWIKWGAAGAIVLYSLSLFRPRR